MHNSDLKDLSSLKETMREPLGPGELEQTPDDAKELKDFVVDLSDSLTEEEEDAAERRRQAGHKVTMFYTDQQLTWDNPDTGWSEQLLVPQGQLYWQNDQFSPMVDNVVKEIAKSRPEFNFFSESADVDKSQVARICNAITHHYQSKLLTAEFLEKEAKQAMFYGGSWRYLRWSPDEGADVKVEEEVEEEVELEPEDEAGPAVMHTNKSMKHMGKTKKTGGFILESVCDDEMLTTSASPSMEWCFWLRRDRDLDRAIVRRLHPNARVWTYVEQTDINATRQSRRARQRRGNFGGANKEILGGFSDFSSREQRCVRYTE